MKFLPKFNNWAGGGRLLGTKEYNEIIKILKNVNSKGNWKIKHKFSNETNDYEIEFLFFEIFDKHGTIKWKFIRPNYAPYITTAPRDATVRRSQLETKSLKIRNKRKYLSLTTTPTKQKSYLVNCTKNKKILRFIRHKESQW